MLLRTMEYHINKKGYFNYQITKWYRNSIPYMRWSKAWMLWALSEYINRYYCFKQVKEIKKG